MENKVRFCNIERKMVNTYSEYIEMRVESMSTCTSAKHDKSLRVGLAKYLRVLSKCKIIISITNEHEYTHASTRTRVHAREYTHASTRTRVHAREYTHASTRTRVHAREYTHASTRTRVHAREYTRASTRARVHKTYMQHPLKILLTGLRCNV